MGSDVVKRCMKVHEKTKKQICAELLDEVVDNMFVKEESATKRKCEEDTHEDHQSAAKRKCGEVETDDVIEVEIDKLNEQEKINSLLSPCDKCIHWEIKEQCKICSAENNLTSSNEDDTKSSTKTKHIDQVHTKTHYSCK